MNKVFVGLLAVSALALVVGQAIADGHQGENSDVIVEETYTVSAKTVPHHDMNKHEKQDNHHQKVEKHEKAVPVAVEEEVVEVQEAED